MESFYQTLSNLGYTHPVHPTLVYLPIGCVMAAFIFSLIALLFNRTSIWTSAKHCIILAFIAVPPTMILGYMDWQYFHGGAWLFPIRMKIILACLLIVLLSGTVVYNLKSNLSKKKLIVLYTLCFLNVVAIGYYGGELVFAGFVPQNRSVEPSSVTKKQLPTAAITFVDVDYIFHRICIRCHKGPGAPYELQLDTYEHVMEGGLEGKVVIPGKPDESELVLRIRGMSKPAMPYRMEPLSEKDINTIVRWIQQGAKSNFISQGAKE